MRILHVVHGFFPEFGGGTERYVDAVVRAQVAAGHDARIASGSGLAGDEPWIDRETHDGVPLYRLHRIGIDIDFWFKSDAPHAEGPFREILDEVRPDVVHVHHWLRLSRTIVRIAAAAGVPVVATLHDLAASCPRGFRIHAAGHFCDEPMRPAVCVGCAPTYPWQERGEVSLELRAFAAGMRAELDAASRLVVPSGAHGDLLARVLGVDRARFDVLAPGALVSVEPFTAARVREPGVLRLVHWGHFRHDKGVHVLLDALGELDDAERGRVRLTLHGEHVFDDYERLLTERAEGLPVTFAGPFVPADLDGAAHDVAIFPSLCHESHSFVLDEAFALRLPVIVSDRGALPERAGAAGIPFGPGDAAGLAQRIRELLADPARLDRLEAAIPPAPPTMDAHAESLGAIYRDAVAAGPPPGVVAPAVTAARLATARAIETRDVELLTRSRPD